MAALQRGGGMSDRVEIIVPTKTRIGHALSEATITEYAQRVKRLFAERFGGSTTVRAEGSWLSSSGLLIEEDILHVWSFTEKLSYEDEEAVFRFAELMRDDLEQDAVTVIINGTLYIV
jgi:hypothetical protein